MDYRLVILTGFFNVALRRPLAYQVLLCRGGGNQFLEPEVLARRSGKLRLRPGNLDKFMAAGLLVSGIAGLCVTAETLDPAGATQE